MCNLYFLADDSSEASDEDVHDAEINEGRSKIIVVGLHQSFLWLYPTRA